MSGALTDQCAMLFNTPVTLALVILEIFISVRFHKDYYTVKDTKANFVLGLGYVVVDTLSRAAGLLLLSVFYFYGLRLYQDFTHHLVLYWVILVLAEDFSYWFM